MPAATSYLIFSVVLSLREQSVKFYNRYNLVLHIRMRAKYLMPSDTTPRLMYEKARFEFTFAGSSSNRANGSFPVFFSFNTAIRQDCRYRASLAM